MGVYPWKHHQYKSLSKGKNNDYNQPEISIARKIKTNKAKVDIFSLNKREVHYERGKTAIKKENYIPKKKEIISKRGKILNYALASGGSSLLLG